MKFVKRLAAVLMCGILLFALSGTSAEVSKREIVYAVLTSSGDVSGVYIVNDFESPEPAGIADFGQYSAVTNLSGLDAVDYEEGIIAFEMPAGRWQYQGSPKSLKIPWDVHVTYALDGEPVAPEDLSGADGVLEMAVKVSLNPELRRHAEGVTLQLTLTLDGMKALDIKAPDGTIAAAGVNRTLAFIVMPGIEDKTFSVSARVRDFSMAGIQIAGVRMVTDTAMYKEIAEKSLGDSPLKGAAGGFIDSFLGGQQSAPLSFADERNGEIAAVQYVIMVDGIAPRVIVAETQQTPETAALEQTVWTRLLSLFGK